MMARSASDGAFVGGPTMSNQPSPTPRFLRTPEAGRLLGLSGRTLEKHRTYGTGPVYRKIGGRVVYAESDLLSWADRGLQQSTTDPARGQVSPARPRQPAGMGGAPQR
jgi:predicted DNA-binding transcriptional regulator AlpA